MVLMELHQSHPTLDTPHTESQSAGAPPCPASNSENNDKPHKKSPLRTCIATREQYDKGDLLRFCISPAGEMIFDHNHKLPGRGMYVVPQKEALERAITQNLFAKAAKKKVTIARDLLNQIDAILYQKILDTISLSRRAGDLIISAEKIKKYIQNNKLDIYITTSHEDSDTRKTLQGHIGSQNTITLFTKEALADALKLDNPTHLGVKTGALSKKIKHLMTLKHKITL